MKNMLVLLVMTFLLAACDPGSGVNDDDVQEAIGDALGDSPAGDVDNEQGIPDGGVQPGTDTGVPGDSEGPEGGIPSNDTADAAASDSDSSVADNGDGGAINDADTNGEADSTQGVEPPQEDTGLDVPAEVTDSDVDTENGVDSEELGGDTESATTDTAQVECVPTLVINEVDYDVPGKDTAEFVELYNPTACDMPLADISLVLVNGGDMEEYRRISLVDAGVEVLGANEYLVIHGSDLVLAQPALSIPLSLASGFIQNGPDGLALLNEATQLILDSFCYESEMTAVLVRGIDELFNLVEGTVNLELKDTADESVSLSRMPNGQDTGDSAADWALSVATPGAANTAP